jgi:hypothetical protein
MTHPVEPSETSDATHDVAPDEHAERLSGSAGLSLLVPGLGQLSQRRYAAAAIQFGAALTYGVAAISGGWERAVFLAAVWNVWSAVDAYWHDRE